MNFIGRVVLTFSLLVATTASAVPRLDIDADTTTPGIQASRIVAIGTVFEVQIHISDVSGLYSYDIGVDHDPTLLDATATTEGNFLQGAGSTFFLGDDSANPVNAASTLLGAPNGQSGSGLLFTIQYSALATGISSLEFLIADLVDENFDSIEDLSIGGARIIVQAAPLPSSVLLFGAGLGLMALHRRRS